MQKFSIVLSVVALLIVSYGLFYTVKVGKMVDSRQSEHDTDINPKVQAHPYLRNPIFLTYLITAALITAYIIYMAVRYAGTY
ncbi:hypothetical protein GJU40_16700 [Bacillus lacus]|uniref:Uncharacterized protein n=1 Tax=Metabacillus lacus TaxID=1983721 RepID=A0A7X2J369_9BACI|nr:hypothetical protein [Metabacillus lacus]MRX73783.1 hypothetical protein [Metabacillus lacus]